MVILQTNRGASCFFEVRDVSIPGNYEIKMLQNNSFRYVPPTELREIDGKKSLYVKIDGLGTLVNRFQKVIPDKKDLEKLLIAIKECMNELKDYMLSPGGMIIDMEHILYSLEEDNYKFMYVPGSRLSFREQMKNLFEEIMRIFDHKDREGVVYLYDIYSHFLMDNFTPEIFCKLIKGSENKSIKTSKAKVVQKTEDCLDSYNLLGDSSISLKTNDTGYIAPINSESKKENTKNVLLIIGTVVAAVIMYLILGSESLMISAVLALIMAAYIGVDMIRKKEEEETRNSMEPVLMTASDKMTDFKSDECFDEKIRTRGYVLSDIEHENLMDSRSDSRSDSNQDMLVDTTVLSEDDNPANMELGISKLMPCDGNCECPILLIEGETRIGRLDDVCDVCIDTPEISRVHVVIEKYGKEVTLKDVGSTNGTYLNERRLIKDKTEKLESGDIISLAGLKYECK